MIQNNEIKITYNIILLYIIYDLQTVLQAYNFIVFNNQSI